MSSTILDSSTLFWLAPASAAFSEEIAAAPKSAAPGRELRRLGSARLNSSQLRRMKFAIAELDRAEDGRESLSEYRRVRIGFPDWSAAVVRSRVEARG
jgi:hypothetical protein